MRIKIVEKINETISIVRLLLVNLNKYKHRNPNEFVGMKHGIDVLVCEF